MLPAPFPQKLSTKRNRNLVHSAGRKAQTSVILRSTARCNKLDPKRCLWERNKQLFQDFLLPKQISSLLHFQLKRHVGHPRSKSQSPKLSHLFSCHPTLLLLCTPQMGKSSSHKYMSNVIGQLLSMQVCLLVKELLALAPEVRRCFKVNTSMKDLLSLPARA